MSRMDVRKKTPERVKFDTPWNPYLSRPDPHDVAAAHAQRRPRQLPVEGARPEPRREAVVVVHVHGQRRGQLAALACEFSLERSDLIDT